MKALMPPSERKGYEREELILLLSDEHCALIKVQSFKLLRAVVALEVLSESVFRWRHSVAKGALVLVLVQVHVPSMALGITLYGLVARLANVPSFCAQHIGLDEILDSAI